MTNKNNCYLVSYQDLPITVGKYETVKVCQCTFTCKVRRQLSFDNPVYNFLPEDWYQYTGLHDDLMIIDVNKKAIQFVEEHLRTILKDGDKFFVLRQRDGTPMDHYYWKDYRHSELFYYYEFTYHRYNNNATE